MDGQRSCLPQLFSTLALEIRSLAESGVQPSLRASWPRSPRGACVSTSLALGLQVSIVASGILRGCWSGSGPHAYTAKLYQLSHSPDPFLPCQMAVLL